MSRRRSCVCIRRCRVAMYGHGNHVPHTLWTFFLSSVHDEEDMPKSKVACWNARRLVLKRSFSAQALLFFVRRSRAFKPVELVCGIECDLGYLKVATVYSKHEAVYCREKTSAIFFGGGTQQSSRSGSWKRPNSCFLLLGPKIFPKKTWGTTFFDTAPTMELILIVVIFELLFCLVSRSRRATNAFKHARQLKRTRKNFGRNVARSGLALPPASELHEHASQQCRVVEILPHRPLVFRSKCGVLRPSLTGMRGPLVL